MIVEVCINYQDANVDRVFDYMVPFSLESHAEIGKRVYVEFGVSNRIVEGLIVGQKQETNLELGKLKKIKAIIDKVPILSTEQLELAFSIKKYYALRLGEALNLVIPSFINKKDIYLICAEEKKEDYLDQDLKIIYKKIKKNPVSFNSKFARQNKDKILQLLLEGFLKLELKQAKLPLKEERPPFKEIQRTLTDEQKKAIGTIKSFIDLNVYKNILLYGVTGSGKTEVYIQAIKYALSKGKNALLLVPEISLTPQMIENLKDRLDVEIAVYHSRMNISEKYESWYKVKNKIAKVVVGPRSSIFAPISDLGIIIIDEEHEQSYKADNSPRINAVEVAQMRAKINNIPIVLGSATPSVEHFYYAQSGKYTLAMLNERINKSLPTVYTVDMKNELLNGNKTIFSRLLLSEIEKNLKNNEQVLLFLNRRGYSTFVICKECGYVYTCPNCSISLTFHKEGYLKCHYCNHTEKFNGICPKCNGKYIRQYGSGTQRIEEEIKEFFKDARILRMDRDTTTRKNSIDEILQKFKNKEADILIGTQMVAKGLHFPDLTLVGVINADGVLNMPDFRSKERTFQLLTQVSGRSGRDIKEGRVVIQTYNPDDYSILAASKHNYFEFYKQEIKIRKAMKYPPFSFIANFITISQQDEYAKKGIEIVNQILKDLTTLFEIEIYGPSESAIFKMENKYRYHILTKFTKGSKMIAVANKVKEGYNYTNATLIIDVNPLNTL